MYRECRELDDRKYALARQIRKVEAELQENFKGCDHRECFLVKQGFIYHEGECKVCGCLVLI